MLSLSLSDLQDALQPDERMRVIDELMTTAVAQVNNHNFRQLMCSGLRVGARRLLVLRP